VRRKKYDTPEQEVSKKYPQDALKMEQVLEKILKDVLSQKEPSEPQTNQDVPQATDEKAYKDKYTAISPSSQEKRA